MRKSFVRHLLISATLLAALLPAQAQESWKQSFSQGQQLSQQGQYLAALRHYDRALEINPNAWEIYLQKAHIYEKMGLNDKVIANFDAAMAMHPRLAQAYLQRAAYFERRQQLPQAKYDLEEGVRHLPYNADLRMARARFYLRHAGDALQACQMAMDDLDMAIRVRPQELSPYNIKIDCYRAVNDHASVEDTLSSMIANGHQHSSVYLMRALVRRLLSQDMSAMQDLSKAIAVDAKNRIAYFERGHMYLESGMCQSALDDLKMACKLGLRKACYRKKPCTPPAPAATETVTETSAENADGVTDGAPADSSAAPAANAEAPAEGAANTQN